jgi:5-methylcytosine-specific restriction endonuclease McrA
MPKLQTLKPAVKVLDTRIGSQPTASLDFSDPRRGSRHERGYGTEWEHLRAQVLKRDGYQCQACRRAGRLTAATHVDHVVEKADGGTDDPANLQSLCRPCHDAKSAAERSRRRGYGDGPRWPLLPGDGGGGEV